jgi:hypothetical protein
MNRAGAETPHRQRHVEGVRDPRRYRCDDREPERQRERPAGRE